LSSPQQEDEWGFALGNEKLFSSRYPLAWRHIDRYDADQFTTERGLFTFTTISAISIARLATEVGYDVGAVPAFNADEGEYFWKIISTLPASELSANPQQFMAQYRTIYGSMLLLVVIGSFLLARSRLHQQRTAELGQYERRFRRTLETIQLAAVSLDRNGRVTFANDYFQRLTGRSSQEIIGLDWLQSFIPADKQRSMAKILDKFEEPARFPRRVEMQVMAKDNEPRLVAWHNTLTFDAAGRLSGVTAIGEDITERRGMEEELHRLFRAVDQSSNIIMITDNKGRIEYVNQKFYDVTGYTADEILGNQPAILSSGETSADEYRELWDTITAGGEWRGEFHNRRKNGELYWEAATISAIRGVDGEVNHFLAVKEDITERKQLQQTIDDRNRELARAQTLATLGRMASMIAHDLRNPLSSVKMGWQIVNKKYQDDHQVQELGEIARDQIHYMEAILSDMLTFSRPEAVKLEWLSPDKLLRDTLAMVRNQLDEAGVVINEDTQQGLPTFSGDAYKLRQVIVNLISNAIQATMGNDEGDRIINVEAGVELSEAGTLIRFSVCDNGDGIDEEQAEKLFEPFYTTRAKGTGLGLAIVRQIVEQHRGNIWLRPGRERGTCAELTLPTIPADDMGIPR
jgi:PAS domain S-box-containing protein